MYEVFYRTYCVSSGKYLWYNVATCKDLGRAKSIMNRYPISKVVKDHKSFRYLDF
ncbi:hypothetical protein VP193E371_P0179 [Vibrio phage 193E37-1]|nr:hypothetical protein VP193E371_P0179 [Vibrio phage 193E37-1]